MPSTFSSLSKPLSRRVVLSGLAVMASGLGTMVLAQAAQVTVMAPQEAFQGAADQSLILIDIRRPEEWLQTGVAEGAIGLDMTTRDFVPSLIALRQANPDTPLAMICRTGNRSNYVTSELAKQGFPGLVDVSEGMAGGRNGPGWLARKLPVYEGRLDVVQAKTGAVLPRL